MAHAVVIFLGLIISGFLAASQAAPTSASSSSSDPSSSPTEHESCQIWDGLAKQLTTSTGAQQVCLSSGSPCTRIDCSGAYEYNIGNAGASLLNLGKTLEVDYCFGVILNHCHSNLSLDFYMQVPEKQVDQIIRVHHNTLLSIPGLSYSSNSSARVSAQGYLYFQMQRHRNTVSFSVTVKVRMKFAGLTYWPNELQRRLIRNETVPVPPCRPGEDNSNSTSIIPPIALCHPPHWKRGQSSKNASKGLLSGDLGKLCNETKNSCSQDAFLACDDATNRCVCGPDFEMVSGPKTGQKMCQPKIRHGKPCASDDDCNLLMDERCHMGLCDCQESDYFNPMTMTCEPSQRRKWPPARPTVSPGLPHVATKPPPAKKTPAKQSGGQNTAAIVGGAVVGGLVVLGGLLVVAYFAIRRLRRPYNNRELLLEGEDSDGIM